MDELRRAQLSTVVHAFHCGVVRMQCSQLVKVKWYRRTCYSTSKRTKGKKHETFEKPIWSQSYVLGFHIKKAFVDVWSQFNK